MNRLTNKAFLQKVKESVHSIDPQADAYLFGSRARGNHRKDSDWDILVLTQKQLDLNLKYTFLDTLTELELKTAKVVNPVIRYKPDWPNYEVTPFYQNIKEEGVLL